jgi:hypothetical protein
VTDNRLKRLLALLPTLVLVACQPQGPDFALPDGDVDAGQALFVSYGCISCHTIPNTDLPEPEEEGPVRVVLGGRVSRVKTYPELVTAIINPSHRLVRRYRADEVSRNGESLMVVYNDVMTVTELINLVAFLESRYEEFERPGYRYTPYSTRQSENE